MDKKGPDKFNAQYDSLIENLNNNYSTYNLPSFKQLVAVFEVSPYVRLAFDLKEASGFQGLPITSLNQQLRRNEKLGCTSEKPSYSENKIEALIWEHNNTSRALDEELCKEYIRQAIKSREHFDALKQLCADWSVSVGLFQPYLHLELKPIFENNEIQSTSPDLPLCVRRWLNDFLSGAYKPPKKKKPSKTAARDTYLCLALASFQKEVGNAMGYKLTKNDSSPSRSMPVEALNNALANLKSRKLIVSDIAIPSADRIQKIWAERGPIFIA